MSSDNKVLVRRAYDAVGKGDFDALGALLADDMVFVRATMTGTHQGEFMGMPATGNKIAVPLADFMRVKDGKLAEHWGVTDVATMMEQLGGTQD